MLWRLFTIQLISFVISLFFCQVILKLLKKSLYIKKYKITEKFSYLIVCFIMLIVGIVFGKEVVYSIL